MASRRSALDVKVVVDAERTTDAFKRARRDIRKRTKAGVKRAGERATLPTARARAVGHAGAAGAGLVVKARSNTAYLTARSAKLGRIIGLHEFGGVVKAPIRPKAARRRKRPGRTAVLVNGQPVAQVTTPRVYRARGFLRDAVRDTLPQFERILITEVLKAFDPLDHIP